MYQTESNRMRCINRGENVVNNMIKIIKSYLLDKTLQLWFQTNITMCVDT
jgi:hypothetical protein